MTPTPSPQLFQYQNILFDYQIRSFDYGCNLRLEPISFDGVVSVIGLSLIESMDYRNLAKACNTTTYYLV